MNGIYSYFHFLGFYATFCRWALEIGKEPQEFILKKEDGRAYRDFISMYNMGGEL